jgi:hypothetical protein
MNDFFASSMSLSLDVCVGVGVVVDVCCVLLLKSFSVERHMMMMDAMRTMERHMSCLGPRSRERRMSCSVLRKMERRMSCWVLRKMERRMSCLGVRKMEHNHDQLRLRASSTERLGVPVERVQNQFQQRVPSCMKLVGRMRLRGVRRLS